AATTASVIETIDEEANRITGQPTIERETYADTALTTQTSKQQEEPQYLGQAIDSSATVQQASFSEFEPVEMSGKSQQNLDLLLDIPLQITVELGRTKQKLQDILELDAGSIVELDKLAGEPVDVLVNSKLIAKGEVVVIDENFGVRITDIV